MSRIIAILPTIESWEFEMPFAELGAGDVTDQPGWEALPDHRAGSYQASTSGGALPRTEQSDWPQKPHRTGK